MSRAAMENRNALTASPTTDAAVREGPIQKLIRFGFWIGVYLAMLGQVISFYPGAECGWFMTAGLLSSMGILVSNWRYRLAAAVLCVLCFNWAYAGYERGLEYQATELSLPGEPSKPGRD